MFGIDSGKLLLVLALLVIAGAFYLVSQPVRTVAGNVAIPTKNDFVFLAPKDAANGTLHIHTTKPIPAGADMYIDVRHNGLSERPEQRKAREDAGVNATYIRDRPFFDPAYDFPFTDWGTFAGLRTGGVDSGGTDDTGTAPTSTFDSRFVAGLRVSPFRLCFGTLAPDFLLAPHDVGLGLSAYAPPDIFGARFDHWGIGIGRLFSTSESGRTSNCVYLSFSTKDF